MSTSTSTESVATPDSASSSAQTAAASELDALIDELQEMQDFRGESNGEPPLEETLAALKDEAELLVEEPAPVASTETPAPVESAVALSSEEIEGAERAAEALLAAPESAPEQEPKPNEELVTDEEFEHMLNEPLPQVAEDVAYGQAEADLALAAASASEPSPVPARGAPPAAQVIPISSVTPNVQSPVSESRPSSAADGVNFALQGVQAFSFQAQVGGEVVSVRMEGDALWVTLQGGAELKLPLKKSRHIQAA